MMILLIVFILTFFQAQAYEIDEETRLERFIDNFYSKPHYVENHPMVKTTAGIDHFDMNNLVQSIEFKRNYSFSLAYGFFRKDTTLEKLDFYGHASEWVFFENISTTFKNFENNAPGINTDTWRFGFTYEDGFGQNISQDNSIMLLHAMAFTWSHIDYDIAETVLENDPKFETIRKFDENIKFGNMYQGGIRLNLNDHFNIDLLYQKSLMYRNFRFFKWSGSYLVDNVVQRWIDYFEPDLIDIFGDNYPVLKFAYKNTASFILYKMRENSMYYPFDSDPAFYSDSYKIAFTFVF